MSPGTGRIKSPMVHSPLVPALPPMGGRPPTSTTLNTSTSSWTSTARALAILIVRLPGTCVSLGMGTSLAALSVCRRVAIVSRNILRRSLSMAESMRQIRRRKGNKLLSLSFLNLVNPCMSSSTLRCIDATSARRARAPPMLERALDALPTCSSRSDTKWAVCKRKSRRLRSNE